MKRFLSGITPSGDGSLHIGNYLGAVRQFIKLAREDECFLMVADLLALTTVQDQKQLSKNIETLILNELALLKGFLSKEEFEKVVFFRQSDVPMHAECQSIINNVTPLGLLKRAHAYKDKLQKDASEDDINVGLFSYPMLMAADILLYQTDLVPVGKDQKQHVEIARDIAERFNKKFKKQVFKLPEPYILEEVAVVAGTDGKRKMSKTLGNIISIFESEDVIHKQVMGTYTDPQRLHATDPGHIEGNMVFTYLGFFGEPKKVAELTKQYKAGKVSDVAVKEYLFESLIAYFAPARKAYEELKANPAMVTDILKRGQARTTDVAGRTMMAARDVIGLTMQYSFFRYSDLTRPGPVSKQGQASTGISIDEFARVELKVGKVTEAVNKEGSDKLIRLTVDFGEAKPRIIFTGVRPFGYTTEDFAGRVFFFVTNLAPRRMMGEESQGMILAVDGPEGKPLFVSAEGMPVGAKIR
jgi:tryptophanyl-tRNA synthetase